MPGSDDLLALSSRKSIRNPFGIDFHFKWDGRGAVLKGYQDIESAPWVPLIPRLAEHVATRLFNLIANGYHDRKVAELKSSGQEKLAKKFHIGSDVENKIWFCITGEMKFPVKDPGQEALEAKNFALLEKSYRDLESSSQQKFDSGESVNFSAAAMVEHANEEAMEKIRSQGINLEDPAVGAVGLGGEGFAFAPTQVNPADDLLAATTAPAEVAVEPVIDAPEAPVEVALPSPVVDQQQSAPAEFPGLEVMS